MAIEIYMIFNGNCREAVEYYSQVFKTEEPKIMTFGDSPQNPEYPLPEDAKNLVMHANLTIGDRTIMFSDTFPGSPFVQGNNISLTYMSKDIDDIKSVFNKLKDGGKVEMDLQETFWSKCYGNLTDKFGIHWQVSLESEQ
ncbi:VOC family protein [Bacillus massilinigeriensis]|uniref:VOC family protein n=1 Tax=Bacillus massilionigeriensis TaxID=1805475 RepID=UPI00096B2798|nr:VOC family protein [Bacillus massilionigeriensis]